MTEKPHLRRIRSGLSGLGLGLGLALGLGWPAPASAQDMTLVYARYHMAIRAAVLCRGVAPDAATWRRWAAYIDAKTEHELGAGERLTAIEGAKTDVRILVRTRGCDDEDLVYLLSIFDAELAGR